jgi:hypothetical protein
VNTTMHGGQTGGNRSDCGGDGGHGGFCGGHSNQGGHDGFGHGYGGRGEQRPPSNKQWQLCDKDGHTVHRCWKRFDHNFQGEEKSANAAAATPSYGVDTAWYADSATTNHVTGELDKLTMREQYEGQGQTHTADGTCMCITHR